ncbi:ABC transporter ATP-binding protein [Fictibacillus phosphorivorans]|uniref:ABC transporter ATP-binding protein n=1 Tax=Fictibacillus phosphorivorans TaxID=1221500 RepID=UPI00203DAECB|nr:ABC transporter ATP-binding protein [Fictibacillus phosphorivorans]MCM3719328.1 ABC transporter ATP-binding protein/permease [Fictibacillus phosphorivorans]MCM3776949.1 ABC transporter ATP-binding protein/permease [Fictibacillus phosphorivorans]
MSQLAAKSKNRDGRRVLAFLRPHKKWVFADAFVIAVSQVFSALIPTLALGWLVDTILPGESNKLLWGLMWLLVFAAVADLILMVIDEYFCHHVAKSVTNWQKLRLFKHLQVLPFSFYQNNQSGEMMARVSDDPDTLHNFLAWEGSTFMASVQGVVLYSAVLLWIHPFLMITSVVLGVIFYLTSNAVGRRTRQASANARKEASRYLERLRESVTGIHLSRVLGVSDGEVQSVAEIRKLFIKESRKELKARMQSIVVIGSYNGLALAVVYGLSAYLIWNDKLTAGEMLTAAGLVAIAANEMQKMLRNWLSVRRTGPALDRSEILLSEKTSRAETEKGMTLPLVEGAIKLKDVVFSYPEKEEQVLKGLSFEVQPGEAIALVGPSGSGKSTIVDLLLRLYEPESGSIYLDGKDISTVDAGWLRSQIAIVSQDVQLRNGSIADNLRIAKQDATDEELISALKDSGLGDFLQTLPEGINTVVGERGSLLSGGQKQRLSLARALVKDAAILILDEASSALDPITEVQVNEAINKRKSKQTVLIISHRLSTVLAANRIIVMENGKVIEIGKHESLLNSDHGVYSRLFKREAEIGTQAFSK